MEFYETQYDICVHTPDKCDPASFTASQGSARAALTANEAKRAAAGEFGHAGDEPSTVTVTNLIAEPFGLSVTAETCIWDTGVVLAVGPVAPATVVINADKATRYFRYRLYFEAGRWLVGGEQEVSPMILGVNKCGA
jgi:hypothetical protein